MQNNAAEDLKDIFVFSLNLESYDAGDVVQYTRQNESGHQEVHSMFVPSHKEWPDYLDKEGVPCYIEDKRMKVYDIFSLHGRGMPIPFDDRNMYTYKRMEAITVDPAKAPKPERKQHFSYFSCKGEDPPIYVDAEGNPFGPVQDERILPLYFEKELPDYVMEKIVKEYQWKGHAIPYHKYKTRRDGKTYLQYVLEEAIKARGASSNMKIKYTVCNPPEVNSNIELDPSTSYNKKSDHQRTHGDKDMSNRRKITLSTEYTHHVEEGRFEQHPKKTYSAEGVKYDYGKPSPELIPAKAEHEVSKVLAFGAAKYSADNWRKVDNGKQRYLDASLRHINAYRRGLKQDEESDLHHIAHAITCLLFVLEKELEKEPE